MPVPAVMHSVVFGATLTLPWRDRRQGAIAAASSAEQEALHERDARALAASAEIEAARAREVQARREIEIYTGGFRALAAKNLEVVRETYRLGRGTLFNVLDETRRYLEVENAYTTALLAAYQAHVALASALGNIR